MLSRILGFAVLGLALCTFSIDAQVGKDAVKDVVKDKKVDTKKTTDVTGDVKSVDKKEGSFTIVVDKKDRKFLVTDDTKFVGPKGGKRGTGKEGLSDDCMDKGYEIRVVPGKDVKNAAEVHLPNRKPAEKDKKDKK
jgi:hypothetical protein